MTQSADTRQHGGAHYTQMTVQPWNVVDTWPLEQRIGFYRGNALKYIMRLNDKDAPADNVGKAAHYCEKLAEVLREADSQPELPLCDPLRDMITNPKVVIKPKPGDRFTVDIDGERFNGTFPRTPYYAAIDEADTVHPDLPAADMCLVLSGETYTDDTECDWCGHGPCKSGANDPRIPRVTCPATDTECGQLCKPGECRRDRNAR